MIKKIVGFSIVAALLTVPVFAQEDEGEEGAGKLKITGAVKTGIRAHDDDVSLYSDDLDRTAPGTGLRADLNALYDAGNWGVKIGLRGNVLNGWRYNMDKGTTGDPELITKFGLHEGFAFAKFLDGMIDLKGGLIDSAVWNTAGLHDENLSNGFGVRLEVTPIQGLSAGIVLGGTDAMLYGHDGDYLSVENFFKRTTIGVSYKTDAFYAAAAFKLKADGKPSVYHPNGGNPATGGHHLDLGTVDNALVAGFGLTAVENLSLTLEALFLDGLSEMEGAKINVEGVYTMDKIHAGAEVYLENLKDFYVLFIPKVGYDLSENLIVDFYIPLNVKNAAEKFCAGVKPAFTWKLNENSKVVLFDQIDFLTADEKLHNTVQLDFVYSF